MTADEVAELFKVGRSTVDRLVAAGLPVVLIGRGPRKRTYRIRRSVLMEWVAEREGVIPGTQIPQAELERMRASIANARRHKRR
jgi:excisionase family DNA binding protein